MPTYPMGRRRRLLRRLLALIATHAPNLDPADLDPELREFCIAEGLLASADRQPPIR